MNVEESFIAMDKLAAGDDPARAFKDFYADDVIRQIGKEPSVGRDATQKQTEDFPGGLNTPQTVQRLALAFDHQNNVSIAEYEQTFNHTKLGERSQRVVVVQRWRDGRIYEEAMYVHPLVTQALSWFKQAPLDITMGCTRSRGPRGF